MGKRKDLKPEGWVPESSGAAEDELRKLLAGNAANLPALQRSWLVAIEIAPILTELNEHIVAKVAPIVLQGVGPVPSPAADVDGHDSALKLLGGNFDSHAVEVLAAAIPSLALGLMDRRVDDTKDRPGHMTVLLVPYLYACCGGALGVRDLTGREWALSDYAFNPNATKPTSEAFWRREIELWRKHRSTGGRQVSRDAKTGALIKHDTLQVEHVRRDVEARIAARRQRNLA